MSVYFVTGTDTGIGKTVATGLLARHLLRQGFSVATQKLVQTGSGEPAEDIRAHRALMGRPLLDVDREGLTCPYVFPLAASPHLAARVAGRRIDPEALRRATAALASRFDHVLVEGAGGVRVPLCPGVTILDYLAGSGHPVFVVTATRLGSINHTLLTLDALRQRGLEVRGIIVNRALDAPAPIDEDSLGIFREALAERGWRARLAQIPAGVDVAAPPDVDFSDLFAGG